jgi:hypothetical protein
MHRVNSEYEPLTAAQLDEEFDEWFAQIGYLTEDVDYNGVLNLLYGEISSKDASLTNELLNKKMEISESTNENIRKNSLKLGINTNLVNYENGSQKNRGNYRNDGKIDSELLKLIKYTFTCDTGMFDMGEYMWKGLVHLSDNIQNYTTLYSFHSRVLKKKINIDKLTKYKKFCNRDMRNYGEKFTNIYDTYKECFGKLDSKKISVLIEKELEENNKEANVNVPINDNMLNKTFAITLGAVPSLPLPVVLPPSLYAKFNPFYIIDTYQDGLVSLNGPNKFEKEMAKVYNIYWFLRTIVLNKLYEKRDPPTILTYLHVVFGLSKSESLTSHVRLDFKKTYRFLHIYKYIEHIKSYYKTVYFFRDDVQNVGIPGIVKEIDTGLNGMYDNDIKKLTELKDANADDNKSDIEKIIKLIKNFKSKRRICVYERSNVSNNQNGGADLNLNTRYNQYGGVGGHIKLSAYIPEFLKKNDQSKIEPGSALVVVDKDTHNVFYGLPTKKTFDIDKNIYTNSELLLIFKIEFNSVDIFTMYLFFIQKNEYIHYLKTTLNCTALADTIFHTKIVRIIFNEKYKIQSQYIAKIIHSKINEADSKYDDDAVQKIESLLINKKDFFTNKVSDSDSYESKNMKKCLTYFRLFRGVDDDDEILGTKIHTLIGNDENQRSFLGKVYNYYEKRKITNSLRSTIDSTIVSCSNFPFDVGNNDVEKNIFFCENAKQVFLFLEKTYS